MRIKKLYAWVRVKDGREGNINIKLLCFDNVSVLEEINPDER